MLAASAKELKQSNSFAKPVTVTVSNTEEEEDTPFMKQPIRPN